mmetsp:Transcript_4861/g.8849  ORF Transcript_4861/g.8849 Transcript_4861/m.8849 type:complete len:291 (+) Transcript_4861:50-922(+)
MRMTMGANHDNDDGCESRWMRINAAMYGVRGTDVLSSTPLKPPLGIIVLQLPLLFLLCMCKVGCCDLPVVQRTTAHTTRAVSFAAVVDQVPNQHLNDPRQHGRCPKQNRCRFSAVILPHHVDEDDGQHHGRRDHHEHENRAQLVRHTGSCHELVESDILEDGRHRERNHQTQKHTQRQPLRHVERSGLERQREHHGHAQVEHQQEDACVARHVVGVVHAQHAQQRVRMVEVELEATPHFVVFEVNLLFLGLGTRIHADLTLLLLLRLFCFELYAVLGGNGMLQITALQAA